MASLNLREDLAELIREYKLKHNKQLKFKIINSKKEDAILSSRDEQFNTPLHLAVFLNREDLVEKFLKAKANPNVKNKAGRAPLLDACVNKNVRIARLLLEAGADVNAEYNVFYKEDVDTPVGMAVILADVEMVRLLVEYKCDPNILDKRKMNAVITACVLNKEAAFANENFLEIIKLLAERIDFTKRILRKNTVLHAVVSSRKLSLLRHFLSFLMNGKYKDEDVINYRNNEGDTPLHFAFLLPCLDMAKDLLACGADPNIKNYKGKTPLDYLLEFEDSALRNENYEENREKIEKLKKIILERR